MADRIDQLPNNNQEPNSIDLEAIQQLFKSNQPKPGLNLKKALIPTLVFALLNLPFVDTLIKNNVTESEMASLLVKAVAFYIIYVIVETMTR